MSAVAPTLRRIRSREREFRSLLDHELVDWTRTVGEVLRSTDWLLERLEALNLRGEVRAPQEVEAAAQGVLLPAGIAARDPTVQELLDGVLDVQEPILSELRACRLERLLRAGAGRAVVT